MRAVFRNLVSVDVTEATMPVFRTKIIWHTSSQNDGMRENRGSLNKTEPVTFRVSDSCVKYCLTVMVWTSSMVQVLFRRTFLFPLPGNGIYV
jgi:hypothetical protein